MDFIAYFFFFFDEDWAKALTLAWHALNKIPNDAGIKEIYPCEEKLFHL